MDVAFSASLAADEFTQVPIRGILSIDDLFDLIYQITFILCLVIDVVSASVLFTVIVSGFRPVSLLSP